MADSNGAPAPGVLTRDIVGLFCDTLNAIAARSRTEAPFSDDLAGGVEPIVRATQRSSETFRSIASGALGQSSEVSLAYLDEQIEAASARDLLDAALATTKIPERGRAPKESYVRLATGALGIPWLEIAKEIIDVILGLIGHLVPAWLKKLIEELMHLIDKIFGGRRHLS